MVKELELRRKYKWYFLGKPWKVKEGLKKLKTDKKPLVVTKIKKRCQKELDTAVEKVSEGV